MQSVQRDDKWLKTDHAGGLDGLAEAGGVGLAPELVAGEVSRAVGHDEGEGADVLAHAHEREEAHAALRQNLFGLKSAICGRGYR